jgi:hypothetical protein
VVADDFDKKSWLIEYKHLKKEATLEDRERFRPLLRIKNDIDIREFVEDVEKLEKKQAADLARERD